MNDEINNTNISISSSFLFGFSWTFGGGGGGGLLGWETFLYNDDVDAVREIPSEFTFGIQPLTSFGLGSLLYLNNAFYHDLIIYNNYLIILILKKYILKLFNYS